MTVLFFSAACLAIRDLHPSRLLDCLPAAQAAHVFIMSVLLERRGKKGKIWGRCAKLPKIVGTKCSGRVVLGVSE